MDQWLLMLGINRFLPQSLPGMDISLFVFSLLTTVVHPGRGCTHFFLSPS